LVYVNMSTGSVKSVETHSAVPFLQLDPDPTSESQVALAASPNYLLRGVSFYFHATEAAGQQIIN
jgi:hypothetical protein